MTYKDPEKKKSYQKEYNRKYYQAHKHDEDFIERRRKYQKEYMPKWVEKNREKVNAYNRNRRLKRAMDRETEKTTNEMKKQLEEAFKREENKK